jgi:hypothetical protein
MMTETEPPEDETELETPIKIRWTGYARNRICEYKQNATTERGDRADCVIRTLSRQKTNAVIKTVEEADALANEMNGYINEAGPEGRIWVNGSIASACERVQSEVISGMKDLGYVVDASGRSVNFSEPDDDAVTPEDVAEQIREHVREHGAAEVTDRGMTWTVTDPEGVQVSGRTVQVEGGAFTPGEYTEVKPADGEDSDEDEDGELMTDGGVDTITVRGERVHVPEGFTPTEDSVDSQVACDNCGIVCTVGVSYGEKAADHVCYENTPSGEDAGFPAPGF